jgi:hypothetical protein
MNGSPPTRFARLPSPAIAVVLGALTLCPSLSTPARADDLGSGASTAAERLRGDTSDRELSGRQIYERVLANRFDAFRQSTSLKSGDRGGNEQSTRFDIWFEDVREAGQEPAPGSLLSRTLVRYTHPFDIRHTGYLVLNRLDRHDDQFLYLASERRVKRINLRGEAVFGTDFSLEDVLPREVEDADYERIEDAAVDGVPCFRVAVIPKPEKRSEYSRFEVHIEKQRYLPLLTRYWNDRGVQTKELRARRDSIELHGGVWVPMQTTMRHLQHESFTTLEIDTIEPNPVIKKATFDLRRLESK